MKGGIGMTSSLRHSGGTRPFKFEASRAAGTKRSEKATKRGSNNFVGIQRCNKNRIQGFLERDGITKKVFV